MVAVDYDGVSRKLMIILMIELGIWVILACANFIRSSHFWRQMVTIDYDGFSTKLMIILMIEFGIWVIRVSGNFIQSGDTFQCWSGLVWSIFW